MFKTFIFFIFFTFLLFVGIAKSQSSSPADTHSVIDETSIEVIVNDALETFYTPGLSVAIVKDGDVLYEKGFGVTNIKTQQKANAQTLFRLASVSKAFTVAGLAVLVDQDKLAWDDKVADVLPTFRLKDAYASAHMTVKDLLTHKSGLVSGAGDSMIWPEPSGFNRDEVVSNLKYLTPEYPFASEYSYSNVLYITAGQVIEKVSGIPFDDFIDQYVFQALDMDCYAGAQPEAALTNVATGYAHNDERGIYPVPRNGITGDALMSAAAGGMVCSASEMTKWINALLSKNTLPFASEQLDEMWESHTILGVSDTDYEWDGTHFRSYGLGWRLSNIGPYKFISHTGTLSGYQAYLGLVPEQQLGIVILNNGSNYGARGAVMQAILKAFLDNTSLDWIAKYEDFQAEREAEYLANFEQPQATLPMLLSSDDVVGEYEDTWFGIMTLYKRDGDLRIASSRMKTLVGTVTPFQSTSFKVEWDNQNAQSDAFIHFELDVSGNIKGARMHPFTVNEQTNHEYRDMFFLPVSAQVE